MPPRYRRTNSAEKPERGLSAASEKAASEVCLLTIPPKSCAHGWTSELPLCLTNPPHPGPLVHVTLLGIRAVQAKGPGSNRRQTSYNVSRIGSENFACRGTIWRVLTATGAAICGITVVPI